MAICVFNVNLQYPVKFLYYVCTVIANNIVLIKICKTYDVSYIAHNIMCACTCVCCVYRKRGKIS